MSLLGKINKYILILLCSCIMLSSSIKIHALESNIELNKWEHVAYKIKVKNNKKTWDSIAEDTKIPASILKRYNKQKTIQINDEINIPAKIIYQVKNGETAIGVAIKFGMKFSELILLNDLKPPFALQKNRKIKVTELTVKINTQKPIKITNPIFIWPVNGKVVSNFGVEKNGSLNDGIRILVTGNNKVKAAKSGTIVYIGNEIGSYGNIIIIQHKGEWISSYGGLDSIDVTKGDIVKVGQKIGEIKDTKLYFSLRDGSTPVNPLKYFKKNKGKKKL